MNEVLDIFKFVVLPTILALALIVGLVVGLSIANAHWNCSQWTKHTGGQTQVMAAECYVKNGSKWEIFDTYVKASHLDLQEQAK